MHNSELDISILLYCADYYSISGVETPMEYITGFSLSAKKPSLSDYDRM